MIKIREGREIIRFLRFDSRFDAYTVKFLLKIIRIAARDEYFLPSNLSRLVICGDISSI